jgi:hypothetical protein
MTSVTHKYDWLQTKGIWGVKSLNNEKITAMATEIQTLKGHLKANKKLGDALKEGGKRKKKGNSKTKNKKINGDKAKQKEDEKWKKVPPKDGEKKSRKWANTLTIGVCTTWCGVCISLPTANLARKGSRTSRRRSPALLPTPPRTPPPPLPWLTLTSRPSLPLLDTCKGMMKMKNDGARRHACGSFC